MKKIAVLAVVLLGIGSVNAQQQGTVTLFANAGYTLEETVPYDFGDLKIKDGLQWGGGLEYYLSNYNSVEFKYNRFDSDFTFSGIFDGDNLVQRGSGSIQTYMLGYNNYFVKDGSKKAVPFIGGSIGLGIADSPDISAETGFAWDVRVGVKMKGSGPVSLKLQAYLQSMLTTAGYDYWNYYGYTYAVPDYSRILQFGFGAVIGFDVKK
ncbi:hypothetical protein ACSVH2_06950 [Flavobacterium sp. RSB2_4_14]|uniref:hypothetical protein n=1 Tax=Flavobacterium sp. RSB2_4_14 TaxID=3447665 RepID=UPI003F3F04E7